MSTLQTLLSQAMAEAEAQERALAQAQADLAAATDSARATIAALQAKIDELAAQLRAAQLQAEAPAGFTVIRTDLVPPAQAAATIRAALKGGGKLYLPAGDYPIEAADPALQLVPGTELVLHPDAILRVVPNGRARYLVLRTADRCTVRGGQFIGDRFAHDFSSGGTHEWGCGLMVAGDTVLIEDVKLREFTGDGLGLPGSNITLRRVVSTRNRRQGASVYDAVNVLAVGCQFTDTGTLNGQAGANPMAGVDIEPDQGAARNIVLRGCTITGNTRDGVTLWAGQPGVSIEGVLLDDCTIAGNKANGVNAKAPNGSRLTFAVRDSRLLKNAKVQIRIDEGANARVDGCTFARVADRADFTLTGTDVRTRYDLQVLGENSALVAGTNQYQ